MIARSAERELKALTREFKAVVVTGPRQSGKTTLVQKVFSRKPYVLLEEPDVRSFAVEDPRRFLEQFPQGAVLDEVQRAPELFSYIQGVLDRGKEPGKFILTGSCNFRLMESISQSLAGRVGIIELYPFSLGELQAAGCAPESLDSLLFQGLYPAIYDQEPRVSRWYNAYVMTYIERDARQLINLKDLALFQRFLGLCAANVGQLINTARMGADCGVHHNTIRSWLSVLETSYIVFRLQPHFSNFRKRLVKSPKLYFCDVGLAARLLEIDNERHLARHPLRGALFENWAVVELLKARLNRGLSPNLYFWRNHVGLEIDAIADHGSTLLPVEIKSGATVPSDWLKGLERWSALAGSAAEKAWLVYGGDSPQKREKATVVPWHQIGRLCKKI